MVMNGDWSRRRPDADEHEARTGHAMPCATFCAGAGGAGGARVERLKLRVCLRKMAGQPLTANRIETDPDGMLAINPSQMTAVHRRRKNV
ncbi:MAG: hypothetical protein KIT61_16295 [Pyrinomonadaceae bacterium]|nr:hypothetical protein [Pyrinomonadaceae bacterium]